MSQVQALIFRVQSVTGWHIGTTQAGATKHSVNLLDTDGKHWYGSPQFRTIDIRDWEPTSLEGEDMFDIIDPVTLVDDRIKNSFDLLNKFAREGNLYVVMVPKKEGKGFWMNDLIMDRNGRLTSSCHLDTNGYLNSVFQHIESIKAAAQLTEAQVAN